MRIKTVGCLLCLISIILSPVAICDDSFDPHNILQKHKSLRQVIFALHPDVEIVERKRMISAPDAFMIAFRKDDMYGIMICEMDINSKWHITAYNDQLFRVKSTGNILLDEQEDHDPFVWYEVTENKETYYLTIEKIKRKWTVVHMFFDRSDHPIQYRLSEDRQHLVVTDLVDPRIYWPINIDLSLSNFNVEVASQTCENAIAYMYDANMRRNNSYEHIVVWEQDDN